MPHLTVVPQKGMPGDGVTFIKVNGVITEVDLTSDAHDRYNSLVKVYGKEYLPALTLDKDITKINSNKYIITESGYFHFAEMDIKLFNGIKPQSLP